MTALLNITQGHIVVEGDKRIFTVTVTNKSDGTAYDFTGVTIVKFTIKKDPTDAFSAALVKLNSTDNPTQVEYGGADPGAGKVRVTLLSADTDTLATEGASVYDIRVKKGGEPQTLCTGSWPAFTHAVSDDMT